MDLKISHGKKFSSIISENSSQLCHLKAQKVQLKLSTRKCYTITFKLLKKPFHLILHYWLTKFTNADNNLNKVSMLLLNKPKRTWYSTG